MLDQALQLENALGNITYSYLDDASRSDLTDLLKRFAKEVKRSEPGTSLASQQNRVAVSLGFKNWSLLHRHLAQGEWNKFYAVRELASQKQGLGEFLRTAAVRTVDEETAVAEMKEWARRTFTPLVEFAFLDSESENVYAIRTSYMADELQSEFEGKYPHDLVYRTGIELDVDEGPWGVEDYDD